MSFNIAYIYQAIDKFTAPGKAIVRAVKGISKSVDAAGKGMDKLSVKTAKTSSSMLSSFKNIAAGALTYLGFRELLSGATAFETSLADLSAITGAVGADLKFLEDKSLSLAAASNTAQSEVAGAIKMVASAKSELLKDPQALTNVTKQILLLKNASGIDLAQAAQVTTDSLNQFGAGAEEAARFVNVLAAGSKVGASEVGETGVAVVKSGVAAKMAKVGFEELNAMIQVLAKNGVKADIAGTGLKTALLKLETSGVRKLTPSIVGINTALENLAAANLDAEQMQKFFGLEAITVGAILKDNVGLIKQWTTEITGTNVANEQAARNLSTLSVKFNQLILLIKGQFIRLYIAVAPALSKIIDGIINIKTSVRDFAAEYPKLTKFITIVAGVAAAVGSAIVVFKALAMAIGLVKVALTVLTGPIGLAVAAISGIIYLVSEFSGRWDELPGAVMDAINSIVDFLIANNPVDLLINSFTKFVDMVKNFDFMASMKEITAEFKGFFGMETEAGTSPSTGVPGQRPWSTGFGERASGESLAAPATKSTIDINMNVNDRGGVLGSVQSTQRSGGAKLNTGVNLK